MKFREVFLSQCRLSPQGKVRSFPGDEWLEQMRELAVVMGEEDPLLWVTEDGKSIWGINNLRSWIPENLLEEGDAQYAKDAVRDGVRSCSLEEWEQDLVIQDLLDVLDGAADRNSLDYARALLMRCPESVGRTRVGDTGVASSLRLDGSPLWEAILRFSSNAHENGAGKLWHFGPLEWLTRAYLGEHRYTSLYLLPLLRQHLQSKTSTGNEAN